MEKVRPTTGKSPAEALGAGGVIYRTLHNANTEREAEQYYLNYNTVIDRAVAVFGSELKATHWLSRPNPDFAGRSPLEALTASFFNPAEILDILGKIEHGVYF